ncbi:MAG: GGDEF domain-containing protein [Gemmatimonas sp.]
MKIGPSKPLGGPSSIAPASARRVGDAGSAPAVSRVADSASVLGIPESEFTPKVRSAILSLLAEVDRLRRDVEESRSRIAYLERLADEDPLAPVANRRAFVRELSRMMSFAERYGAASSLLYFDIDNMKAINDAFGHTAGDAAIKFVAQQLVANVRESDTVGRLGGDEFGAILVNVDQAAAQEKGHQLQRAIELGGFQWQGKPVPLTITFGAFSFTGGGDAGKIIEQADRAMYERKQADRRGRG